MQDQLADILTYVKGVLRYKWIIVIIATIVSFIGWGYVYQMPDKYRSEAKVHVDTRTMLRPLLRGLAVQADVRGLVAIMKKLMFTQQNMLKIAELAGIQGDFNSEGGRAAVVAKLKSGVGISGGRDEIFSISYESTDSFMAQKVVQAVLSVFSEQTQQSTMSDMGEAQRFIDEQIKDYEQRLRNAEKAKENFERVNLGLLPGQGENQITKIQAIKSDLEQIELTRSELSARKKTLQEQLNEALDSDDEWGLIESSGNESVEDARISNLQEQKEELLIKYTENHPYVKAIDATIQAIRDRSAEEDIELIDDEPSMEAMSNPYVQAIKSQINQVDAEISSLNSRAEIYKAKLSQSDEEFNSRLAIQTEMQNLNRDYETIKRNYLNLIDRREQASISEKVDNQAAALKFKIADPANRPLKPSSPNRALLYSAVFAGGLILGLSVGLLLVLIRPVFFNVKDLRTITGLPVLGSVTAFRTDDEINKSKFNNLMFISLTVTLLILYGYVMISSFSG